MKLRRLALRNFRGVDDRETVFAEVGVTVVEGPNESGKSSLFEALDVLLTHLDDSKKRELAAVKPVHKDAGAEVEAEIETGPYHFRYRKRFHRRPETELTIMQPVSESLTGRQAHERVRQMLEETLDLPLWNALRIEQGQGLAQANLSDKKSLAAALDRAAGVARTGDEEESLYAAAQQEHERYFTPASGAPRKETLEAEARVQHLTAQLERQRAELQRLERDIERSAVLEREQVEASAALEDSRRSASQHAARLQEIERLDVEAGHASAALAAARRDAQQAGERAAERRALAVTARDAARAHDELVAEADLTLPALDAAAAALAAAEAAHQQACAAADEAEARNDVARQDFDFHKEQLDLLQLRERKGRIDGAVLAAARAQEVLAHNAVTDAALRALSQAHLEQEKARAALTAGSPELQLRALAEVVPEVDGIPRRLARGETLAVPVAGVTRLVVKDLLELEVRTGASVEQLRGAFTARQLEYSAACRTAGVESLDAAVAKNAAWRAAKADLDARDARLAENLRDLTREQLERKIEGLGPRVASYLVSRTASFPIPNDFDSARDATTVAKAALEAARSARAEAERRRVAAQGVLANARERRQSEDIERASKKTAAAVADAALKEGRAKISDEDLEAAVTAAERRAAAAEATSHELEHQLAGQQPDSARLHAENAEAVHARAAKRLRDIDDELIAVRARLLEHGEDGLAERIDQTASELERAQGDLARRRTHAQAARLLFVTLDHARDAARRAYVAPLRDKIEELGRVLYGPSFHVELSDELRITQRTLDERTVPFESLSGGAQEQLGVVSRLACAMLVAEDGGVPVLIDDALGYTDAARLASLGALLSLAGRRCQVIVLTCVPERYRNVGGATVVRA